MGAGDEGAEDRIGSVGSVECGLGGCGVVGGLDTPVSIEGERAEHGAEVKYFWDVERGDAVKVEEDELQAVCGEEGYGVWDICSACAAVEGEVFEVGDGPACCLFEEILEVAFERELLEVAEVKVEVRGCAEVDRVTIFVCWKFEVDMGGENVWEGVEGPDNFGKGLTGYVPMDRTKGFTGIGSQSICYWTKGVTHGPIDNEDLEVGAVADDGDKGIFHVNHCSALASTGEVVSKVDTTGPPSYG